MKKADWQALASKRRWNLQKIAKALGNKHPITKMLGTLAWGRHEWEVGPDGNNLQSAIQEAAALDGCFHILNLWARDNDTKAQRVILGIWHERRDTKEEQEDGK